MQTRKLGVLRNLNLRDYWKHEAMDFTRWLALPENIALLSDEIGIGIEVVQAEASVGRFNVDILAKEETTGKHIIIENQLEMTNHGHLGQLLTYAAGHDATFIIWVVKDAREEHRQAIDWLNEHTDEGVGFFLVAIELWQIGDSDPAPKFRVISKPNEWLKTVQSETQRGGRTEGELGLLEFWTAFRDYAAEKYPEIRPRKPYPQIWYDVTIGRSDSHVALFVDRKGNKVRTEFYIMGSKPLFRYLHAKAPEIERQLGPLSWLEQPDRKHSRAAIARAFTFSDPKTWPPAFDWMCSNALKFRHVFLKALEGYDDQE